MSKSDFCKVRESVRSNIGSKVVIKQDRGRNRIEVQEGVLKAAYPSVFTILVTSHQRENPPQLLSFSYTDIITKEIRMKLCEC